jgi:hypothetical protein
MEFISCPNNKRINKHNNDMMKAVLQNTNYNYRASNQNVVDNTFASVTSSYMITPKINIHYPKPYMTGKCVSDKERKQEPFDIHTQPRLFSDVIRN